jgi:GntR family transcriptional regulator/MocR family aminotransferase
VRVPIDGRLRTRFHRTKSVGSIARSKLAQFDQTKRSAREIRSMELFLDRTDPRSLTDQLYEQVREAISDGRLPAGSRLHPSRAVAEELQVARSTVTDAYARLTAEGYVEGRRGGGSVVTDDSHSHPSAEPAHSALSPTPHAASIRRYGSRLTAKAKYDLTAGRLDPRRFPLADWRRSMNRALTGLTDDLGHYGDPQGSVELRNAVAHWVARSRGVTALAEQVVITHGSMHAVDLMARVLLRPGDLAVVEEPGYPPAAGVLRSLDVDVVGVPVDEHGLVVDALPDRARLVYVTPSHQYPLGAVLSRERRIALLRWAARTGAAIVEDDYDAEFRYTTRPLEPLHRLDRDGRVIYVGTFSKTLSPALRIGFAVVPVELMPAVVAIRQAVDIGPSLLTTTALAGFIERGYLGRHLRRMRRVYAQRHRAVWSSLSALSGPQLTPLPTPAGLHVSLLAPAAPDDDLLVARAARRDLLISTLRLTYQFEKPQPGIVVGFGAIATEDVPTAITLLADCLAGRMTTDR